MILCEEQERLIALLESGANVFISGVAGSGKSAAVNEWLTRTKKRVGVTASTGIAATHIGGQTVHSWCGAGIGDREGYQIAATGWFMEKIVPVIYKTQVLLIDEISMLDCKMFDLVSDLCRFAKGVEEPFGGLQLVFVGDMGQIEPVEKGNGFCFTSTNWWEAKIQTFELLTIHRQEEKSFADLMRFLRAGRVSDEAYAMLKGRVNAFDPRKKPEAVRLFTHNMDVDVINGRRLHALEGELYELEARDSGPQYGLKKLDENCITPKLLKIKVGARVMLTKNNFPQYANGSLGYVTEVVPDLDPDDGNVEGCVRIKLDRDAKTIGVGRAEWNVVVGTEKYIDKEGETQTRETRCTRSQFPLRLAYCLSIHKAQGSTLERASIDISKSFAAGQAYVALSRVRSLDGLNIEAPFGREKIFANVEAKMFLNMTAVAMRGGKKAESWAEVVDMWMKRGAKPA